MSTDEFIRCTIVNKTGRGIGKQCKNRAAPGKYVCTTHDDDRLPVATKKSQADRVMEAQKRGITPLNPASPRVRGDAALAEELARTLAWIDFCEAQLQRLGVAPDDYDLEQEAPELAAVLEGLSVSKRETITASEFGGINITETVGVNVWEEKLRWNRSHLLVVTKQWIAAGFEARRLEMRRETIDTLEHAVDGIVRDLGHSPRDASVRRIVRDRLREAAGKPRIEVPDDVPDVMY